MEGESTPEGIWRGHRIHVRDVREPALPPSLPFSLPYDTERGHRIHGRD